jgi:hypothetical protein
MFYASSEIALEAEDQDAKVKRRTYARSRTSAQRFCVALPEAEGAAQDGAGCLCPSHGSQEPRGGGDGEPMGIG